MRHGKKNTLGGLVSAMGSNEPHNSSYPMRKAEKVCLEYLHV
jgi:hypothetical protein